MLPVAERKSSIMEMLLKKDVTLDDLELFFADNAFVQELQSFIFYKAKALKYREKFVLVDYTKDLDDIIQAWCCVSGEINKENFPISQELCGRKQIIRIKLFHFNDGGDDPNNKTRVTSDYVIKQMNAEGYRPATLPELLAYGLKEFFLSTVFPIVALGSILLGPDDYTGDEAVPYEPSTESFAPILTKEENEPTLESEPFNLNWYYNHRFLGVRV